MKEGYLKKEGHHIYWQETGTPGEHPVLFIHGGPGAGGGPNPKVINLFNDDQWRKIFFDQRGCGWSKPFLRITGNTTEELIEDIEDLRKKLGVGKWLLYGESWGSTLALLYSQKYPDKISGLILQGIFLCRKEDIDWTFTSKGAAKLAPKAWQEAKEFFQGSDDFNLLKAFSKNKSPQACLAWEKWSSAISSNEIPAKQPILDNEERLIHSVATLEHHYLSNNGFIEENQILDNIDKIPDVPIEIVHGSLDLICPVEQAFLLKKALPQANLKIAPKAGHISTEPTNLEKLVLAINQCRKDLDQTKFPG